VTWLEVASIALVCLGLAAGAFLFARRPEFWIEFGYRLFMRVWPLVLPALTKLFRRMDPKTEAEWRKCMLRGGKWDHRRKRCDR
jgi:hypothetical protein